jgi:hypothetical protein
MANLIISEPLARRLEQVALRQNKAIEDVLSDAVDLIEAKNTEPLTREQQFLRKVYEIAREYWQKHGDTERLALTDEELDEQFWLIDHEGIPRLKSEIGTITLPPDPLEALVGILGDGPTDLSESVRETMEAHYRNSHDGSF